MKKLVFCVGIVLIFSLAFGLNGLLKAIPSTDSSTIGPSPNYGALNHSLTPLSVAAAETETVTQTVEFGEPHIRKVGEHDLVSLSGCGFLDNVGDPKLPVRGLLMELPSSDVVDVEFEVLENESLSGTFNIYPAQPPVSFDRGSETSFTPPNPQTYEDPSYFPGKVGEFASIVGEGSTPKAHVRIFPVQYSPSGGEVVLYKKIRITITVSTAAPEEEEWAVSYSPDPGNLVDYLIITRGMFRSTIENFVTWKESKGLSVAVENVDNIINDHSGVDNLGKIRNCIKQYYQDNQVKWVLLVGDADPDDGPPDGGAPSYALDKNWEVPTRYVWNPDGAGDDSYTNMDDNYTPTDYYYAGLTDNWDADADSKFGESSNNSTQEEADWVAEVYVGRWPVRTTSELQTVMSKTINSENNPVPSENFLIFGARHGGSFAIDQGIRRTKDNIRENIFPAALSSRTYYEPFPFNSVAISSDNNYIAAGGYDREAHLFGSSDNTPLWSSSTGDEIKSIATSSDGSHTVFGSANGKIYLFNSSGSLLWSYQTNDSVFSVDISSNDNYIAAGTGGYSYSSGWYGEVYLFDKSSSTPLWSYKAGDRVNSVSISQGGFITAGSDVYDKKIFLFDRADNQPEWIYQAGERIYSVSISDNGDRIAAGSVLDENKLYYFDNVDNTPIWTYFAADNGGFRSVAISSDGSHIVAGGQSSPYNVYLFENSDNVPEWIHPASPYAGTVMSVSISSDDNYIAAGSYREVQFFHKSSGTPQWTFTTDYYWVNSVSVSSDGSHIAAAGDDGCVRLFDNSDNTPIWTYNEKGVPSLLYNDVINAINKHDPPFINSFSHGGLEELNLYSRGYYDAYVNKMTESQLTNSGYLHYAFACLSNGFDTSGDTVAENIFKAPSRGAVAYVGGTRVMWSTGDTGVAREQDQDFWENFFTDSNYQYRPGRALYGSKAEFLNYGYDLTSESWRKDLFATMLLGDPELCMDPFAPSAPTLAWPVDGENIKDNTPNLDWNLVSENSSPVFYRCYVSDNSQFPYDNVNSDWVPDDNYQLASELSDGVWYWRVQAKDGGGNVGDNSATRSFRIDTVPPSAPSLIAPENQENTSNTNPLFRWTAPSENSLPLTYHIWIDNNSDFTSPENNNSSLTDNQFNPGFLQDNKWYWRVCATDNAGNTGDNSVTRWVRVDTQPPSPPSLALPNDNDNVGTVLPTFEWTNVTDNTGVTYTLQIDNNPYFSSLTYDKSGISDNTHQSENALPNDNYWWHVRGVDGVSNEGNWSENWRFTVTMSPLKAPNLILPDNQFKDNDTTPTFKWENVTARENNTPENAARYEIWADNNSNFSSKEIENDNVVENTYTASALSDDWYHWRVRAYDNENVHGLWSETRELLIDTVEPPAPTLGPPENNDFTNDNTPTLNWENLDLVENAKPVKYYAVVSDNSQFPYDNENTIWKSSDNQWKVSELLDGIWYWRVKGKDNASNEGDWSGVYKLTIDTIPPENTPTLLAPENENIKVDNNQPKFEWEALPDADNYKLQYSTGNNFSTNVTSHDNMRDNWFTPSNPIPDNKWYWRVQGGDNAGNVGPWSENWWFIIDTHVASPTSSSPENGGYGNNNNTPTFGWSGIDDPTSVTYHLQVDNDPAFGSPRYDNDNISDNQHQLPVENKLNAQGTWHWRVKANDNVGHENWSDNWEFTFDNILPTITGVSSSNIGQNSATISWTTDEDSDSTVEYGTTEAYGLTESGPALVTSHSIDLSGLSASTTYHYRVKSVDAAGNENTSPDNTFTTSSPPPSPPPPAADFTISVNPTSGSMPPEGSVTASVLVGSISGYSDSVSLTVNGQPSGVSVSLNPVAGTPYFESTMTVNVGSNVSTGSYEITITGTGANGVGHTTTFTLTVQDFTISVRPESGRVERGGSTTATVELSSIGGYGENVSLSASGQPSNVNVSFNPATGVPPYSSTTTIDIGDNAPTGTHTIEIVGTRANGREHTCKYELTVSLLPIQPGEEQAIEIGEAEVGEITLRLLENVSGVSINVERLEKIPENVPTPSGQVHSYVNFEVENVTDEDIENLTIKFRVDKSWVQEENIDPTTIRLNRYHADKWQELSTSKIGENATTLRYSAGSPGFSVFAITAQAQAPPGQLPTAPSGPTPPYWVMILTGLVLVAVLITIIWKYLSRGEEEEKFKEEPERHAPKGEKPPKKREEKPKEKEPEEKPPEEEEAEGEWGFE